jgi:hypothetical protein
LARFSVVLHVVKIGLGVRVGSIVFVGMEGSSVAVGVAVGPGVYVWVGRGVREGVQVG